MRPFLIQEKVEENFRRQPCTEKRQVIHDYWYGKRMPHCRAKDPNRVYGRRQTRKDRVFCCFSRLRAPYGSGYSTFLFRVMPQIPVRILLFHIHGMDPFSQIIREIFTCK